MRLLEPRVVTIGAVIEATLALLRRHWQSAVLVYGAFAAAMTAFEVWAAVTFPADDPEALFGSGEIATILVGTLLAIPVYYLLTERIMVRERLCNPDQPRRYGAMLGASILTGAGILIGFLLIIFPGFILMARWSIWGPLIVAQGRGASDSMQVSWNATSRSQGALATVWLLVVVGCIALIVAHGLATGSWDEVAPPPSYDWDFVQDVGSAQILESVLSILSMFVSIAAYRLLVGSIQDLDAVFA